jgi:colanic acid/amylovoran biosynthesis glycosyltransferase
MAAPFRLAHVLKRYPRLSETFIINEMLELQRQGIAITIVAMKDPGEAIVHENVRALRAPIYYFPPKACMAFERLMVRSLQSFAGDASLLGPDILQGEWSRDDYVAWLQAAMFAPFLSSLGIDRIHAHFATSATTAALALSMMTGIPFSFTAHAKDIYHESVNPKALAEKIHRARFVITVSDFNKRYLQDVLASEGWSGRILRLYNGIDLERFRPSAVDKDPELVVSVGRLVQKKGFEYLVEACKILKEQGRRFRCVIIGEGEERIALEKRLAQYSLEHEVALLGPRTQAEVMQIVQAATAFVLPCVIGDDGNRDGLPTVLLEAMALGVPVISTTVTGIPEIIETGCTGLLVEERNPHALAQALQRLLDSAPLHKQLREAALQKVRKDFNLAVNAKTLLGYFLTGGSGHAHPVSLS